MYWPTIIGVWGILIAMATIDIGGYGNAHIVGAIYYFVILYMMVVNFTVIAVKMYRWDTRSISLTGLYFKVAISVYLTCVWFYCLYGVLTEQPTLTHEDDQYVVILEWNLFYDGIIWICSFAGDWKYLCIVLNKNSKEIA